jgi:hypothetical protein
MTAMTGLFEFVQSQYYCPSPLVSYCPVYLVVLLGSVVVLYLLMHCLMSTELDYLP